MRVGEEMAADVRVGIDDDVRQEPGVGADHHVVADDDVVGSDVGVGADVRRGGDDGGGVDSRRVDGCLVEEFERAGEGEVWIHDAEGRCGDGFEGRLDQDRGGAGGAGEADVFRVGDEGDLAGASVFQAGGGGDFGFRIAVEGCAQLRGKIG